MPPWILNSKTKCPIHPKTAIFNRSIQGGLTHQRCYARVQPGHRVRDKVLLAFKNCPGSLAGGRSSYQNSTSFYIFRNILKYRYFDHAIHFEKSWKVPWEPKKWLRIAKFIRIVDLPPSTVKTDLQSLINEPNSFSEQRHLWIFPGNFLGLCRLLSVLFDFY